MRGGLCLVACAGPDSLDRTLLVAGGVAAQGGSVVLLTYTPGLALHRTYFGLEVVVRRDEDLLREIRRLDSFAISRGAGALYLDDDRIDEGHAAALRVLSSQLPVGRYGPRLSGGAGGELVVDPYAEGAGDPAADDEVGPLEAGGCFGLRYLPVHPALQPLRDGRGDHQGHGAEAGEVGRVTIACREDEGGLGRGLRALEALSSWRPRLTVSFHSDRALAEGEAGLPPAQREVLHGSRHQVIVRQQAASPQLAEALLCDLAVVDSPESAALCAYLGTPAVALSGGPAEARRAEALGRSGACVHVPDFGEAQLSPAQLGDLLWSLCADQGRRALLSRTARRIIDGHGAERVASALLDLSQSHGR